jgi:hypothetical protein
MLIYVGGVAFVLDRLLLGMALKRASVGVALRPPPPAESRKLIADS